MDSPSPGEQELLGHALEVVTALDRRVWRRSITSALLKPDSRLRLEMPKMGLDAAVVAHTARMWVLCTGLVLLLIPIEVVTSTAASDALITFGFCYILLIVLMTGRRFWRAYRLQRVWKRETARP